MTSNPSSLPLTYRPRSFTTVVGQTTVVEVLRSLVGTNQLPQQLLFAGPSGTGKTTLARLTAAAVLCRAPLGERDRADPCGDCTSCRQIFDQEKMHPDVLEVDAASRGRVDEIRELAGQLQFSPMEGDRRVVIVDEAHGLSGAAGNAFLKLLEEPPEHVLFMLATTDPDKMLATNRSRVTELPLSRPDRESLMRNLKRVADGQQWPLSREVASAVVDATDPAMGVRGTLMTLQKVGPALAAGAKDEAVFALLGSVEPLLVKQLLDTCRGGDRVALMSQVRDLQSRVPEQALNRALLVQARENVDRAVAGPEEVLRHELEVYTTLQQGLRDHHPVEATLLTLTLGAAPAAPASPPEEFRAAVAKVSQQTADLLHQVELASPQPDVVSLKAPAPLLETLRKPPHGPVLAQCAGELRVTLHAIADDVPTLRASNA